MLVMLGSINPSKRISLEMALSELKISDYEIVCVDVKSNVSSKPIGNEIIVGADNRNQELKKYALENNIKYDYLCSVEGGFSLEENGLPFVVTYAIIEDNLGKKSTGKSLGIRLRKDMFEYIENGGSINKLIEEIDGSVNNKQTQGITGFLTNGLYSRDKVDEGAIVSAFVPIIFKEKRDLLSLKIKEKLLRK